MYKLETYLCYGSQVNQGSLEVKGSNHFFDVHFYSTLSWALSVARWETSKASSWMGGHVNRCTSLNISCFLHVSTLGQWNLLFRMTNNAVATLGTSSMLQVWFLMWYMFNKLNFLRFKMKSEYFIILHLEKPKYLDKIAVWIWRVWSKGSNYDLHKKCYNWCILDGMSILPVHMFCTPSPCPWQRAHV